MLAVVRIPGSTLCPQDIGAYAQAHLPKFAQPRYVAFVEVLPKTATEKVRKVELRRIGLTPDTIDLEAKPVRSSEVS